MINGQAQIHIRVQKKVKMKRTKDTGLIHSRILDLTKDENLTLEKA